MSSPSVFYILKSLLKKNSLNRGYLNWETRRHHLHGQVLDIGAGKTTDYHEMPLDEGTNIEAVDKKITSNNSTIDFEKDNLPYEDGVFSMVLMYNVLEHIYNHNHLMQEAQRVLNDGGELVGFVPFLMRYHPDPHDYFRYTGEALERILDDAGFTSVEVKPLAGAMFAAQFHSMSQSVPRIVQMVLYPIYRLMDSIYLHLRPQAKYWYPLGYFFTAKKNA